MKILTLAAVAVATLAVAAPARAQTLAWADAFGGTKVNTHTWSVYSSGKGNDELATCKTSNVKLNGKGQLVITARKSGGSYTSGQLDSKLTSACGTLKARIKLPAGKGLWPAFWAVGGDYDSVGWPACGELDAMENLGNAHMIYGSVHAPGYDHTKAKKSAANLAAGYHIYGVTWTPTIVRITLDGKVYATYMPNMATIFGKRFQVKLNLAVGGSWPGSPNSSTRFPASMVVDWVRAYRS